MALGTVNFKQFENIMAQHNIPQGMQLIESPHLTEQEQYAVTVDKTTRERWLLPLLHPVTVPFEPWIKTRVETRYRTIPAKNGIMMDGKIFIHPAVMAEIMRSEDIEESFPCPICEQGPVTLRDGEWQCGNCDFSVLAANEVHH